MTHERHSPGTTGAVVAPEERGARRIGPDPETSAMNTSPTRADRAPTAEQLALVLDVLHRRAIKFDLAVRTRLKLGPQGYLAVRYLLASDKDIGMAELGDVLGVTAGSCTILVNRLERAGHLRRRPDPGDRRRTNVEVTEPTRDAVLAARGILDEAVREVCEDFDPEQRSAIHRFLTAVTRSYTDAAFAKHSHGANPPDDVAPPARG